MRFGPSLTFLFYFVFISALIAVTVIDLYHQIILGVISIRGIGVGLLGSVFIPEISFWNSLIGLVGGGSLFLIATLDQWLFKREGIGGGDIKCWR